MLRTPAILTVSAAGRSDAAGKKKIMAFAGECEKKLASWAVGESAAVKGAVRM